MSKKKNIGNTNVYHAHDRALKQIFANKIMMKQLIKTFLKPAWVESLDFDTLKPIKIKHITNDLRVRENDVVWEIKFHKQMLYLIVMVEFQSRVDHNMALRIMTYTGLILQDVVRQKDPFHAIDNYLPPVFPLVFYTGISQWNAPTELQMCFSPSIPADLQEYQPNMKYMVLDVGNMALEQYNFKSDDILLPLIELGRLDNPDNLKTTYYKLLGLLQDPRLDGLKRDILRYVKYAMNTPRRFPDVCWDEVEGETMMLSERMDRWEKEFFENGVQKGLEQGMQKGLQKGLQKSHELQKSILIRLLQAQSGSISLNAKKRIEKLSSTELDQWINNLLEAITAKTHEESIL